MFSKRIAEIILRYKKQLELEFFYEFDPDTVDKIKRHGLPIQGYFDVIMRNGVPMGLYKHPIKHSYKKMCSLIRRYDRLIDLYCDEVLESTQNSPDHGHSPLQPELLLLSQDEQDEI